MEIEEFATLAGICWTEGALVDGNSSQYRTAVFFVLNMQKLFKITEKSSR